MIDTLRSIGLSSLHPSRLARRTKGSSGATFIAGFVPNTMTLVWRGVVFCDLCCRRATIVGRVRRPREDLLLANHPETGARDTDRVLPRHDQRITMSAGLPPLWDALMLNRLLSAIDDIFIRLSDPLLLAARLVLAWYFGTAGLDKIGSGYTGTAAFMESHGVPSILLPLVILLELGGALFMALGLVTRLTCVVLAIFTIAADVIFNSRNEADIYLFEGELALVAGFLALMVVGAGRWSLDSLRNRGRPRDLPIA
jgi:putative oxidoreductase